MCVRLLRSTWPQTQPSHSPSSLRHAYSLRCLTRVFELQSMEGSLSVFNLCLFFLSCQHFSGLWYSNMFSDVFHLNLCIQSVPCHRELVCTAVLDVSFLRVCWFHMSGDSFLFSHVLLLSYINQYLATGSCPLYPSHLADRASALLLPDESKAHLHSNYSSVLVSTHCKKRRAVYSLNVLVASV